MVSALFARTGCRNQGSELKSSGWLRLPGTNATSQKDEESQLPPSRDGSFYLAITSRIARAGIPTFTICHII